MLLRKSSWLTSLTRRLNGSSTRRRKSAVKNGVSQVSTERLETRQLLSATAMPQDDAYSLYADASWSENAANGVLANDMHADHGMAMLTTGPESGSLMLHDDGSFTYTPDAGFTGTDTFTYRVMEGMSASDSATVTLDVQAQPSELHIEVREVTSGNEVRLARMEEGTSWFFRRNINRYKVDSFTAGLADATLLQVNYSDRAYEGPIVDSHHGHDVHGVEQRDGSKYVRLFVSEPSTVFVAADGIRNLPEWLGPHNGWSLSDEVINDFTLFEKDVEAGDVWIGAGANNGVVVKSLSGATVDNTPYAFRDF